MPSSREGAHNNAEYACCDVDVLSISLNLLVTCIIAKIRAKKKEAVGLIDQTTQVRVLVSPVSHD